MSARLSWTSLFVAIIFAGGCSDQPQIVPSPQGLEEPLYLPIHLPEFRVTAVEATSPPVVHSSSTEDCGTAIAPPPECEDDSGDDPKEGFTDEQLGNSYQAAIVESQTSSQSALTANRADGFGVQKFQGTGGRMQTDRHLYYQRSILAQTSDDDEYSPSFGDWLDLIMMVCHTQLTNHSAGSWPCSHDLETATNPISLPDECGHETRVFSDHEAWCGQA